LSDFTALAEAYRRELLEDTLPFWLPRAVDSEHGGFLFMRDRDGSLIDDDKGVWTQARFTWLLGELYNSVEPRAEWLDACRHGIEFLERCAFDPADGRMWFHLTREGRPIRKRRYAFSESFAAIAYGECARATGEDWAAARARELFERFVEHSTAPRGVEPKFTAERPLKALGFPMIAIATAQELRDSIGLEGADATIDRLVEEIRRDFCRPELGVVLEQVTPEGAVSEHVDGRTLNPGHAIEAAWFLMREGALRGQEEVTALGVRMLDWMWERGWDEEHGGLLYFVDLHGGPPQEYWSDMKFWWPHNEAEIACLYAFSATGEVRFRERHAAVRDWSRAHFADPEHGEWFGYLRRDGSVANTAKGNLWKSPFHLPRMQLECWRLCEALSEGEA